MVGIGIVGIGFMGYIHFLAAQALGRGRVAAIASRDPTKRAGDWTAIRGNFGPPGAHVDLSGIAAHGSFEALLADPAVALVDLCVPNDQHAELAIRALRAGKDVLVEKPIALDVADADRMLAAARDAGRLLMVGHVLPYFAEFAYARAAVESGRFGKLVAAHFNRVIAEPAWSAAIADAGQSGGPAVDLHIHDTHLVGLLCGAPRAVFARGVRRGGAVAYLATQYLFDDPDLTVSAVSGALSQAGRPFAHGFEIYLERATLAFGYATLGGEGHVAPPLSVILPDGTVERPDPGPGDPVLAFGRELADAVAGVETGVEPPGLAASLARQALALAYAEIRSVSTGAVVPLDRI